MVGMLLRMANSVAPQPVCFLLNKQFTGISVRKSDSYSLFNGNLSESSIFFNPVIVFIKEIFISYSKNVVICYLSNLNGISIIKWHLPNKRNIANEFLSL